MNCQEIELALLGKMDGRLGEDERKGLEAHLAACAACRARAQEFERLWGVLGDLPAVEPSIVFDARLRARLAAEPQPSGWMEEIGAGLKIPRRWPRLAVTATVLAVLAVWLTVRPPWERKQPVSTQTPAGQVESRGSVESEGDFPVVKDLPVFENYDIVSNFEALSALPASQSPKQPIE